MPTSFQYEIVKNQVLSFLNLDCLIEFKIEKLYPEPLAKICITLNEKTYRFSDPDWGIISKQLTTLYFKLKEKKCLIQKNQLI